MNNQVEVKINIINQLKLFRQSTFKDKLCFLDEDIQNAQRAKAKNFKVTVLENDNKIIIENDGGVLEDPQCLFSIAESGWDNEVKETENPFGMGFFSNISVSNYIEIYSGGKKVIFDVDKMIRENNTTLEVLKSDEFYQGFKIVLNNFDFEDIYKFQIAERMKMLGQYIGELEVYYNGVKQNKKDLTEDDGSEFTLKIEEDSKGKERRR